MKNAKNLTARLMRLAVAGLLVLPSLAAQAVQTNYYYVAAGGSATVPYDTWGKAATDIQTAVDKASADLVPGTTECVVLVTNGSYTVTSQIAIGKAISLAGFSGNPSDTIIRGGYPASTNRCLYITGAGAVVDGFTLTNGYVDATSLPTNYGGGVYVASNATVRNCRIVGNQAAKGAGNPARGGGVYMANGLVTDCTVASNAVNQGSGAGFYLDGGGTVLNSTIVSNKDIGTSVSGNNGGGFYLNDGGTVSNCFIASNTTLRLGGGVYITYRGRVTRCTVSDNTGIQGGGGFYLERGPLVVERCLIIRNTSPNGGGGIGLSYGCTVQDCLIAGNYSGTSGGGLSIVNSSTRNTIRNCTIVRNAAAATCGGLHLAMANTANIYNMIVCSNSAPALKTNDVGGIATGNTNAFNCYGDTGAAFLGAGSISADPLFANSGSGFGIGAVLGDYTLQTNSPCIGAGTNGVVASSLDMAGSARIRPAWGVVDMGAYEVYSSPGSLTNGFTASPLVGASPLPVVFTGETSGSTNGLLWKWIFGDGATNDWSASAVVSHTYAARTNAYSVTLMTSNAGGETASRTLSEYIRVYPPIVYVATNGLGIPPFETWGTAATGIQAAVDMAAVGSGLVLVSNGVYTVTREITITNAVTVRGFSGNRKDTIIQGGYPASTNRCLSINHPGVVLDGFTVSNGYLGVTGNGAGIVITNGTIRNCIITRNSSLLAGGSGAGVTAYGATLTNCIISENKNSLSSGTAGGVHAQAGTTVVDCQIVSNQAKYVGGIFLNGAGAVARNCEISYNYGGNTDGGGEALVGVFESCLVIGNESGGTRGGLFLARNTDQAVNCTIVGNKAATGAASAGGLYLIAATYTPSAWNTIVWGNQAGGVSSDIAGYTNKVSYSCAPELVVGVSNNITANPRFVNAGSGFGLAHVRGDYHLKAGSPCADTGAILAGMSSAVDIEGNPRILGAGPNMGAYETVMPARGTLLLIR